jgi:hypothetical protein
VLLQTGRKAAPLESNIVRKTPQKGREQRTWKKRLLSGTLRELAVAKSLSENPSGSQGDDGELKM